MTPLNDGVVTIYAVGNTAEPGDKPRKKLTEKGRLRYKRRTVGIKRHYSAMQAQAKVDLLLRVPYRPEVSAQDVAVPTLDGKQYLVSFVQVIQNETPPVMDLTLERLERDYAL